MSADNLPKESKFTTKLILGITTLSVLGLLVMFIITNTIIRYIIYDNLVGIAQRDIAIQAKDVDVWFLKHSRFVEHMATTWMAVGVEPGETGFGPDPIGARFLQEFDSLVGVFVGFENGWHVNSSGWIPPPGFHAPDRPWYQVPQAAGGEVAISLPYVRLLDGDIVASMGKLVPDIIGMEAVVAVDIRLSYVFDMISRFEFPNGGFLIMLGPDGEIIVHPNAAYMLSQDHAAKNLRDIQGGGFLMDSILAGVEVVKFDDALLGPSYFFSTSLAAVNWTLAAVIPIEATEAQVVQYITLIMLVLAFFLLTLLALTLFFITRLLKGSRELEAKLQEQKMNERIRIVEESNKAKSRFLARMSHEIRTPITAVLGISEMQLHNPALPLEIEEAFLKIYNSSNTLLYIVNDILDLSKVEADKMEINNAEYEVASLLGDIVQLNLSYLGSKRLNFDIDVDKNIPSCLIGDELRIKQVLNNLLSNAFKYTDDGTVSMKVSVKEGSQNDYVNMIVVVQDTGRGMNKEQLKALFDEYSRFHDKEHRFEPGTGLGMSITNALLKMMDAAIIVDSEEGKGTTVIITVPQKIGSHETLGAERVSNLKNFNTDAQFAAKRLSFTPEVMPYGRVLVVDDVDANIYVASGLMGLYQLQIDTCSSAAAAIEKVKSGNVYDIIFMDQMMPEMNGTEATAIIRQLNYKQPIVALTADALVGQAEKFLQNGFDGFLSKPIQTVLLNALLHKFVKDKHPEAAVAVKQNTLNTAATTPHQDIGDYFGSFMETSGTNDKIRRDIVRNRKNAVREIANAIASNDFKTAHRLVHSLKGLMGIIGEKPLFDLAEKAEVTFREGIVSTDLIDALNAEMDHVLAKIKQHLNEPDVEAPHAEIPLDKDRAKEIFDKLFPLLETNSFGALELCGELAQIPLTNDLIRQIEAVDCALALKTLADIRVTLDV